MRAGLNIAVEAHRLRGVVACLGLLVLGFLVLDRFGVFSLKLFILARGHLRTRQLTKIALLAGTRLLFRAVHIVLQVYAGLRQYGVHI